MNKLILAFFLLSISMTGFGQYEKNPFPKTITVTGSAEMEIVPDQIYVQIDLKEYEKKGQAKMTIDRIKSDFLKNARALGIPDSAISIASYDGNYENPWLRKKKKEELMASISYQVRLQSSRQMDDLVNMLDDDATQNFAIIRTDHSKLSEFRKQLKIQAIRAAKDKAGYLTAAVDEKLGEAVTINEPTEYFMPYYNMNFKANTMMRNQDAGGQEDAPVDFKKIKLKYDVTVVFALK